MNGYRKIKCILLHLNLTTGRLSTTFISHYESSNESINNVVSKYIPKYLRFPLVTYWLIHSVPEKWRITCYIYGYRYMVLIKEAGQVMYSITTYSNKILMRTTHIFEYTWGYNTHTMQLLVILDDRIYQL